VIQTALEKGFKKAIITSLGVSSSDAVLIFISLMGISAISGLLEDILGVIASIILIVYGLVMIFSKPSILKQRNPRIKEIKSKNEYTSYILKDFF
jgi:threonine/homoserine/homoserine lactone efflux protein